MKKQAAMISKKEEQIVREYLFSEFTIGNALSANILAVIVIFFALFMLNAVLLNSITVVPQQPFTEFVAERFAVYSQQPLPDSENLIGSLIGQFIIILMQIVLDALQYILFGVQKTAVFTAATVIFLTNIGVILLVYLILYRKQVKTKTLIISLVIGFALSCIILNLLAFLVIAFSLSPVLLGYISWWVLLPTTTISIPILIEWITGLEGAWIYFWYIFALFFSTIVSISVFIGSKFDRKKIPESTTEKLKKLKERDDNYLWFFISSIVVTVVSVLWKLIGRFVVEFFAEYKPADELELGEGSVENTLLGVKLNSLNGTQIFVAYFVIITIGYAVGFMVAYSLYRRAAGQKNWLDLYRARHPSKKEQFVRWFIYTTLMSWYWMNSIYIPRHLFPAFDWVQTTIYSAIITLVSIGASKLTVIEYKY